MDYGTISGDRLMHPLYDDDHKVRNEARENWKSISVKNAVNVEVAGCKCFELRRALC